MEHSDNGILGHQSYAVVATLTRMAGRTTGDGVGGAGESSDSGGDPPTRSSSEATGAGVISTGAAGEGVAKYLSQPVSPCFTRKKTGRGANVGPVNS